MAKVSADVVHLRASGVSLLIAVGDSQLPRVLYWGTDLGDDGAPDARDRGLRDGIGDGLGEGSGDAPGAALLPEPARGSACAPGIAGHRDGRDFSTCFVANDVDVVAEGEGAREVRRLTVLATDAAADLAVELVIEMLASGLVRARATLSSTGRGTASPGSTGPGTAEDPTHGQLGREELGQQQLGDGPRFTLDAMTLSLPVPARATELAPYPGDDERLPFGRGTHVRESRDGTPGRDGSALLAAGTDGFGFRSGEVWMTHVGWSGNVRHVAERSDAKSGAGGVRTVGGGELLLPGEISLALGESYAGPWVYFSHGSGLDEASSRFHRFLRALPDHPTKPRPVVATTAGTDLDVARLTALVDASASVGAELFVLGDGWFKGRRAGGGGGAVGAGLGDWYVDKGVFPEGLRPFADYVRSRGLEFGLWFAPEAASEVSDLAREHPDWVAGRALDLSNPDAYAHVGERLHALVEELRPTHLVCDHLADLPGTRGNAAGRALAHSRTRAFYRLLDGLRASFPGLEIEVRSEGAGRSDLEVLGRAHRVRASRSADSFATAGATGILVPPELIALDLPALDLPTPDPSAPDPPPLDLPPLDPSAPEPSSTKLAARSGAARRRVADGGPGAAIWGHLGFEWAAADPVPPAERLADLHAWVALHKRYRALLHSGVVVRSDDPGHGVSIHGVVSGNRREALFACSVGEPGSAGAAPLVRLDGLDPARAYRVTVVGDPLAPDDAAHQEPGPDATASEDTASEDTAAPQGWWERGVIVSGEMLAAHGIQAPPTGPSGVVILRVERAKAAPQRF